MTAPAVAQRLSVEQGGERTWHAKSPEAVLEALHSRPAGLTDDEARQRLEQWGPNELQKLGTTSPWHTFLAQFKNTLILILLAATVVSGFLGHTLEAVVISVIVFFAVLLGFAQEYRAERALAALRQMAAPTARALRNGLEAVVPAGLLVPGDVVRLRAGDRVPADGRMLQAVNLAVDESALTGESATVEKIVAPLQDADLSIGDRRNMAYAGTLVAVGRGEMVVAATGMSTEFGRISELVQTVESGPTPLQENLDRLGRILGRAALVVVAVVVVAGLLRGLPAIDMLIFGIALAVAVVPEALPAVVTISLAIGVRRMVKRNALVRRLPVVETLGSTSVICSDKTGTLTKNEMTVRRLFVDGQRIDVSGIGFAPDGEFLQDDRPVPPSQSVLDLLRAASLASDARVVAHEGQWRIEGDPTEAALVVAATKAGLDLAAATAEQPRTGEISFTSERRQMTTLHRTAAGATVAFSKGAFEQLLASCDRILRDGVEKTWTDEEIDQHRSVEHEMAAAGLRVLAVARKAHATAEDAERRMTLLGLVGIMDPPRPEAASAVRTCDDAGILPIMITGDHPLTAVAIAKEIGLLGNRRVVTGRDLDALSEADFERDVENIAVYARVTPAQKLRVVEAWQRRGAVVAMTGDGVNDAPALKKADVGVAMGVTGTDVSKEAAGMTLLDDNFATIVAAVEEGRLVFGNIKKYLTYLLSCNVGEIVLLAGSVLAGLPLPLTAVQILYVNLATDGLPALALAVDPPDPGLMERKPRNPRTGIFTRPVAMSLLVGGLWTGLVNMGLFTLLVRSGRPLEEAMAMTFVSLVLIQFFNAYNSRSDRLSIVRAPLANVWLNRAVAWELLLLAAVIYVPFLQRAFGTFSLSAGDWVLTGALAFTIVPVLELVKWMARRGRLGELT